MSEFTQEKLSLYTPRGERKYVNRAERRRVIAVMQRLKRERALFGLLLAWTGGRVSEVLAVRPNSFQIERNIVALQTLKRRKPHVREVPIAPGLMAALDRQFKLRELQRDPDVCNRRLWPMSRVTAWRVVKGVMLEAGVVGRPACPRGLRHGFGVGTLQASVPLNMVQKWMGHARISTTAIYADVSGPEERFFAEKFWQTASHDGHLPEAHPASRRKRFSRRRKKRLHAHIRRLGSLVAVALFVIVGSSVGLLGLVLLVAHF
jgi:integrase